MAVPYSYACAVLVRPYTQTGRLEGHPDGLTDFFLVTDAILVAAHSGPVVELAELLADWHADTDVILKWEGAGIHLRACMVTTYARKGVTVRKSEEWTVAKDTQVGLG